LNQRDKLRELFRKHGADPETLAREYAAAEHRGDVVRRRTLSRIAPDEYARRLVADAAKKGWIAGFGSHDYTVAQTRAKRRKRAGSLEDRPVPLLTVSTKQLLKFFDDPDAGCRGHASAIAAVAGEDLGAALFSHFIQSEGGTAEVLPDRCTQGTKSGVRLDRWILVTKNGRTVLYQTEIKNWSAHAIGGKRFDVASDDEAATAYRLERWAKEWDGSNFLKKQVRKVLTPMKSPRLDVSVEPLVCYWTALHPRGATYPFFQIPLATGPFETLSVFSMSSYLRLNVGAGDLTLPMRDTARRLELLTAIFSSPTPKSR
jgi:hypothetical protein